MLDANIEAVILRQSEQLQTKALSRPGPWVGNTSWTAPQKHVAVASSSLDQPSSEIPDRGMKGLDLSAVAAIIVCVCMVCKRNVVI